MKKIIGTLLAISLFLLSGCSKDTITSPPLDKTSGKVLLKIDKTNAPQNVVSIIAYLSRTGYDTLKGSLNLRSDTSADILIQNIPAGQWHLTVNAMNDSNIVVYSGETNVTILDGLTVQVNLTLTPTGQGKGNIYIVVNWGTGSNWIDYNLNPIFTPDDNPSFPNQVSTSKIIYDNGKYKMWYMCTYNAGKTNVWYAESSDGIDWQNKFTYPVFTSGNTGSWDDYSVGPGSIIKDGNKYLMYYNGWQSLYGVWQIGLAESNDGVTWVRYPNPVLRADSSSNFKIGAQSVLKINGKYYMYYTSSPFGYYDNMRINLAISSDGINWIKYSTNPILKPTENWEGVGINFPAVIYDNNHFIMIYNNADRTKFGIAYSDDGINWKKSLKPTLTTQDTQIRWEQIAYPFITKFGNEYWLYYTGTPISHSYRGEICFAKSLKLY